MSHATPSSTEPSRQIHLDFHTSEHLPGIGSQFCKAQFQEALKLGRVNLINVFAKCHHSWSYYPTKVGNPHPYLTCDLLGGEIEACHEIGVKAPIYFTMGWSAHDAEAHPEWCMRHPDGSIVGATAGPDTKPDDPRPGFNWKSLCPSGEYHELMVAQTEEICGAYDVDGFWYDIYQAQVLCYCERCRKGMADAGMDVERRTDVEAYRARTILRHAEELRRLILGRHPQASVYFNGLTTLDRPGNVVHRLYSVNTKNDLEDLPTTWGGYDKFPIRAKFFHKEGKPIVAMSGKFHTSWGEFGGFKHPDAIRFEAASMIAFGASCNIGDQLHPCGAMDLGTYANIGKAYEYVAAIEAYGIGGKPTASLGLWLVHSLEHDEGVGRMLLEEQIDFDVVGPGDGLDGFETVVIPSKPCLTDDDAMRLSEYVAGGGKLLVLGGGALNAGGDAFVLDVGAGYLGPGQFDVDYLVVGDELAKGLVRSPFLNYSPGLRVAPRAGTAVLASVREPYFSRTYGRYCGHQNTPYQPEDAPHPGALRSGNVVYLAHPLDAIYYRHGARVHRQFFVNALRLLHERPMVEVDLPSCGRVSLLHQPDEGRYVAHLLYASPLQRGRCLVIEDLPPLHDVPVAVRLPEEVKAVRLIPGDISLPFDVTDGVVRTTVPRFACHCGVVFDC